MSKGKFKRRIMRVAAARCAERSDWWTTYRAIHWNRIFLRAIGFVALAICIPGAIAVTAMIASMLLGYQFVGLEPVGTVDLSRIMAATGNLPLLSLIELILCTFVVRLLFLQPMEVSSNASLPIDDARMMRGSIRRIALGGSVWLAAFIAIVYGVAAWSLNFSLGSWLVAMLLVVAQVACAYSVTVILSVSFARWFRFPVLAMMLALSLFLLGKTDGKHGHVLRPSASVQAALNVAPTSWTNQAFETALVGRRPIGLIWLLPIPLFVWLAERSLRRNIRIIDFESLRAGMEVVIFSPETSLAGVPQRSYSLIAGSPIRVDGQEAELTTDKLRAAASFRREFDGVGAMDGLRWPVSRMFRFATSRQRVLADLAQPWLRTWRIPWIALLTVGVGAVTLFHFVPYFPADRSTTTLVLTTSLCLGFALMRRAVFGAGCYRGFFQLPVTFEEWFRSRWMIPTSVVLLLMLPLCLLLAIAYLYLQPSPVGSALAQALAAVALVAALPYARTVVSLVLMQTNYFEEHPGRFAAGFFGGLFLLAAIGERLSSAAPWVVTAMITANGAGAMALAYVGCRWIYLSGNSDIKDSP